DPSPADGRPGAPEAGLPQGGDPTADVADGGGVDRDARETQRVAAPGAGAARPVDVPRFTPTGQHELGVAGVRPRLHANLEALRTLRQIQAETRPATADEQRVLARWSGWGAIAQQAFHPSYADEFGAEQAELRSLLDRREYAAARRSTLNAYYTDASLVQVIWDAVSDRGVQGGNILEPGCGSGNFLGFAPQDVHMLGVELDSTSAAISALLYPHAQ